jgi:hypothetical protein
MRQLKFNGDVTLDEVFNRNKVSIYDKIVESIQKSYKDPSVAEIRVVSIVINETEYSIGLVRSKFVSCLESAMNFYIGLEEYEKCLVCRDIIAELKNKKELQLN